MRAKKDKIKALETELREKEQQYQFLVAEYSELSEGLTKNKVNDSYLPPSTPAPVAETSQIIHEEEGEEEGS